MKFIHTSVQSALAASGIGPGSSGLNSGTSGHLTFQHGGESVVGGKPGGAGNITPTLSSSSNKVLLFCSSIGGFVSFPK